MADYNSKQVLASFGGVEMSGFGESSMVSWEWDSDGTTDKIGVDGKVSASKTNDYRGTVTFTLMATSPSNAILSGFEKARRFGKSAIGIAPLFIEDTITGENLVATEAWVLQSPAGEFGNEVGEREWTIRFAKGIYTHPGNSA